MAKASDVDMTLGTTQQPVNQYARVAEVNDNRKRFILQNKGPGTVWMSVRQQENGAQAGIKVVAGAAFADDPPFPHCGEWWAMTDTANTVVTLIGYT